MSTNVLDLMIVPLVRGLFAGAVIIVAVRGLAHVCGAVVGSLRQPVQSPATFAVNDE
jgi:hypothetical protein